MIAAVESLHLQVITYELGLEKHSLQSHTFYTMVKTPGRPRVSDLCMQIKPSSLTCPGLHWAWRTESGFGWNHCAPERGLVSAQDTELGSGELDCDYNPLTLSKCLELCGLPFPTKWGLEYKVLSPLLALKFTTKRFTNQTLYLWLTTNQV